MYDNERIKEFIVRMFDAIRYAWKELVERLYWSIPCGAKVALPWPHWPQYSTSDPNDCWRPYLEENVGIQGIHWQWKIGSVNDSDTTIEMKFLRRKDAMIFVLKYGS